VQVVDLKSDKVRHSMGKLIKAINEFKPDVVLSTQWHLNLALILVRSFLKGNPKLIIREASTPSKTFANMGKLRSVFFSFLYKW
ncbi:hypothetical protein ACKC5O_20580, partial [Aeromonas schubertii]|uniref:hypothetical protein n=1 Tax=Aeromonas schubertii TaxID=652 RepID=UPI0038B5EBD5